jgi:hypothetical protein
MSASILIMDDEPDVADLSRQRFRREARQGIYVMHFAASGVEALERLAEEIQPRIGCGPVGHQHAGHGRPGIARRDQVASPRSDGHDGHSLWRRRAKTPRPRTWRFRVHHEAG